MNEKYCQSCGMPLKNAEDFGTNADGSKNEDYCSYCYEKGEFTKACTLQEMIDMCVPIMVKEDGMKEDEARKMMNELIPTLSFWRAKEA